MSQLDIQTDTEDRIIGLSGSFTKWTNSNEEGDHFAPEAVTITVPENMEAHVTASMTVDDWGYIDIIPISGVGSTIRAINLTSEVASPGPRGGHKRWSGQTNEAIVLEPGQYSITIRQDNAPYGEDYASEAGKNLSFCQVSVTIEYVAILAPVKRNPLTHTDAQNLMDAYKPFNYITEPDDSDIWPLVGGTAQSSLSSTAFACAARLSMAFCNYGATLPKEPGVGYQNSKNQNIFIRARNFHAYLLEKLGAPDFTSGVDFKNALANMNVTSEDSVPIVVWSKMTDPQHVGMGYRNEGNKAEKTFDNATHIWVLYRPDYMDPDKSVSLSAN